jgi:AhpD family alkylhydroperoxidase
MTTDHVARHRELQRGFRELAATNEGVMKGFGALHRAAVADGALSSAVKELMALAVGICTHCEGCIAYHVHDALRAGATRAQVEETIGLAIMMGGGTAVVYGSDALRALEQFEAERAQVS